MQKTNELVSIIMPSYNTSKYIEKSIRSVLNQTYQNWELIIVDDCSTDSTDEVVGNFCKEKRIVYYKNDTNKGAAYSRNYALKKAKGRWIALLDSDDLWETDKLEKQIAFMKTLKCGFSYTEYDEIDENGRYLGRKVSGPHKFGMLGQYAYCWQGCLTVMYDRNYVGLVQIKDIKKNNDYAMWLKVCRTSSCYLLKECLGHYRKRTGSISNHSYFELIKWHYYLWRKEEEKNIFLSLLLTAINVVCGTYKKLIFVKKANR